MKTIIGISHPKQVYMFKNLYFELKKEGHEVLVIVVDKEISIKLLVELGIDYVKIGMNKRKLFSKMLSIIPTTLRTLKLARKFGADLFVGQALPYLALTSFIMRKKFIIFEDTENAVIPHLVANPFADSIVTPSFFTKDFGKKQITINGSFELAYLRSNWFLPDIKVLEKLGLQLGEKFSILRFVGWTANHDIGHNGLTRENKIKAVELFSHYGKVFITSECELPQELEQFKLKINPSDAHSLMYYASLLYGESASMAAEASYLGTPSIFIDNLGRGYTDELSKFGLLFHFSESMPDQAMSIEKGVEILNDTEVDWKGKLSKLVEDKIDVAQFMNWFVMNYPNSKKEMLDKQ
jgi:predicted glycosyltransferase